MTLNKMLPVFFFFIVVYLSSEGFSAGRHARTVPELLKRHKVDWADLIYYRGSSIGVIDTFMRKVGVNRADLARATGMKDYVIGYHLNGRHIFGQHKLHVLMATMEEMLNASALDKKKKLDLLKTIDTLPKLARIERVVRDLQHNPSLLALLAPNLMQDFQQAVEIKEKDIFVEREHRKKKQNRGGHSRRALRRILLRRGLSVEDLQNYKTSSHAMFVNMMRGMKLTQLELSKSIDVGEGEIRKYLRGESIIREATLHKVEEFLGSRVRDKQKLDVFLQKLRKSLAVEWATDSLAKSVYADEMDSQTAKAVAYVLSARKTSLLRAKFNVSLNDLRNYKRSAFTVLGEIARVSEMSVYALSNACGLGKLTLKRALNGRSMKSETVQKIVEYLQTSEDKKLSNLGLELRAAFNIEGLAKEIRRQKNGQRSTAEKQVLELVAKVSGTNVP